MLRLAVSVQVNYTESGNHATDLARFAGTTDGYMDWIHCARDRYVADVCALLVTSPDYCGLAMAILATPQTAFCTVLWSCAVGRYSLAHEIGHLQGARHEEDPSPNPFAYGHGFLRKTSPGRVKTVMAIHECCLRDPYWSSPDIYVGGDPNYPMGTTNWNHNARVLNETAWTISSFRTFPQECILSIYNTGSQTPLVTTYPDPFNPVTTLRCYIPTSGFVTLAVYNTLGQEVAALVRDHKERGQFTIIFDGNTLPSGAYFYRLQTAEGISVGKMMLAK